MRYILNNEGYIYDVSFGAIIECSLGTCTEYKGKVPNGYSTIEDWHEGEIERLNAWKIVDGNLVFDENRAYKLKILYEQQSNENSHVTRKEMGMASTEEINPYTDLYPSQQSAGGYITSLDGTFNKVGNLPTEEVNLSLHEEQDLDLIELEFIGNNFLPNTAISSVNNGIEFTQNKDKTINISGTATDRSTLNLAGTDTSVRNILTFKADTKYLLFGLEGLNLEFYHYDGTDRTLVGIYNGGIISFEQDINVTQVVLVVDKGTAINTTIKPMLQLVSLEHPVMQLTKYKGNLFDEKKLSQVSGYNSHSDDLWTAPVQTNTLYNRSILYNATGYDSNRNINYLIPINSNTTYTLSFINPVNIPDWSIGLYNNDGVYIKSLEAGTKSSLSFSTTNDTYYLDIRRTNVNTQFIFRYIQIEEGTEATQYKDYNGRDGQYYIDGVSTQETRSGKNKFNGAKYAGTSRTYNGITATVNSDGGISMTGTSSGSYAGGLTITLDSMPELNGKTLSVSHTSNNSEIYVYLRNPSGYSTSITYNSDATLILVIQTGTNQVVLNETFNIQIETGSPTEYEAYGVSPSPDYPSEIINIYKAGTYNAIADNKVYTFTIPEDLRSVPNGVADRLWIDVNGDNGIDIEKKVGSVVLNGSESLSITNSGDYSTNPFYRITRSGVVRTSTSLLSNYFQAKNINATTTNAVQTIDNAILLQPSNGILTVDDFKTWLSTHNTEVQYKLATYTTSYIPEFSLEEFEYEEYKNNTTLIDLAGNEFTTSDKITIKDNQIILIKNDYLSDGIYQGRETFLGDTVMPRTYTPYTHAYCHQKVWNSFKYKDPRNVDITKITLKGLLSITDIETEYNFTNDDLIKVRNYIMEEGTLTDEEIELYDINGDGIVQATDYVLIRNMVERISPNTIKGTLEINTTKSQRTIVLRDESGKLLTSIGLNGITTPSMSINGVNVEEDISYSETPTNRYLNGKRIYQRLYTGQMPSTAGTMVDLFNYDFDATQVWVDESMSFVDNGDVIHSVNHYNTTSSYMRVMISKSTKAVRYKTGSDFSTYTYNIVLSYTKE